MIIFSVFVFFYFVFVEALTLANKTQCINIYKRVF